MFQQHYFQSKSLTNLPLENLWINKEKNISRRYWKEDWSILRILVVTYRHERREVFKETLPNEKDEQSGVAELKKSSYIFEEFKRSVVSVTRLSYGIPLLNSKITELKTWWPVQSKSFFLRKRATALYWSYATIATLDSWWDAYSELILSAVLITQVSRPDTF